MSFVILLIDIVLAGVAVFTTKMVDNRFKIIRKSLDQLSSKRTYKTESQLGFIESIITTYNRIKAQTNREPDLEMAIRRQLNHESIGAFNYVTINRIATNIKFVSWGLTALQLILCIFHDHSLNGLLMFIAGLLVTVGITLFTVIAGLNDKADALTDDIIYYVSSVYPFEGDKNKAKAKVKEEVAAAKEPEVTKNTSKTNVVETQVKEKADVEVNKDVEVNENKISTANTKAETVKNKGNVGSNKKTSSEVKQRKTLSSALEANKSNKTLEPKVEIQKVSEPIEDVNVTIEPARIRKSKTPQGEKVLRRGRSVASNSSPKGEKMLRSAAHIATNTEKVLRKAQPTTSQVEKAVHKTPSTSVEIKETPIAKTAKEVAAADIGVPPVIKASDLKLEKANVGDLHYSPHKLNKTEVKEQKSSDKSDKTVVDIEDFLQHF